MTATPDLTAVPLTVEVDSGDGFAELPYAVCERVDLRLGLHPSEAHIVVRGASADATPADTFAPADTSALHHTALKGFSRVRVTRGEDILFLGRLKRRAELMGGELRLTAWDGRWTLAGLRMRGCIVWDPEADEGEELKYVHALPLRFNPEGRGNCLEAEIEGCAYPVPLFAPRAVLGAETDGYAGDVVLWTPLRILRYLRFALLCETFTTDYPWLPRLDAGNLNWAEDTLDDASDIVADELAAEQAPDVTLQGQTASACIQRACELAGAWTWWTSPAGDYPEAIELVGTLPQESDTLRLPVQRGGLADYPETVYACALTRDYEETVTQARCEGAPIEIEASLATGEGGALEQAWTQEELEDFLEMIDGQDDNGTRYALDANGDLMDGSDDAHPTILARTAEAVALARRAYPHVLRAYRFAWTTDAADTVLQGVSASLPGRDKCRLLARAIAERQNQQLYSPSRDEYLDDVYPVRVEVLSGAEWRDAPLNSGLRVDSDGLIYLDGLTDDQGEPGDRVYDGVLASGSVLDVTPRDVRLNAVIRHDLVVSSGSALDVYDPRDLTDEVTADVQADGVGPQYYAEDRRNWQRHDQVASQPVSGDAIDATSLPVTRYYRDDTGRCTSHAQRRMAQLACPRRELVARLIGLQPQWTPGQRLIGLDLLHAGETRDWPCVIIRVVHDNLGQYTEVECE